MNNQLLCPVILGSMEAIMELMNLGAAALHQEQVDLWEDSAKLQLMHIGHKSNQISAFKEQDIPPHFFT